MPPVLLSLTESQALTALRSFLLSVVGNSIFVGSLAGSVLTVSGMIQGTVAVNQLIEDAGDLIAPGTRVTGFISGTGGAGTYAVSNVQTVSSEVMYGGVSVVRGQDNRVPEPLDGDFVVMTPITSKRLSWNDVNFSDGVFTGSTSGGVLTVSAVARGSLVPGMLVLDKTSALAALTVLGNQLTGTTGDAGTYVISPAQTVASEVMYLGQRLDEIDTQLGVQLDFHGPNATNNVFAVDAVFFSEYATNVFAESGFDVHPLYAEPPRQSPFINAEQQYEYRWTMDVQLQVNPVVTTPQQFADEVAVGVDPIVPQV